MSKKGKRLSTKRPPELGEASSRSELAQKADEIVKNVPAIARSLGKDRVVLMFVWPLIAAAAISTGVWGFLAVNLLFAGLWYLFKKQHMLSK